MFVTLTLNPAIDCTLTVASGLALNRVHKVVAETRTPGGKGINVAKAIAAAGAPVLAGGILGRADVGFYRRALAAAGVRIRCLTVPHPTRSNVMVAGANACELKLNREGFPELAFDWERLRAYTLELAARGDVFVLSGSLPARFPADTYARLARLLRQGGKTVVLDAAGPALAAAVTARPAVIKPNREELEALLDRRLGTTGEIVRVVSRLAARHEVVIVSDGPRGAWFASGTAVYHGRPPKVTAVDTTGAGDSLLGQFCASYFPRRELTEAVVAAAVAAGAAAVELKGTPSVPATRIAELARQVRVRRARPA